MKTNLRATAFHKRLHDFKQNAITLDLPETKEQSRYLLKKAQTPNERRYAEGFRNGYMDIHNNEKPLDRYELSAMFYQYFASGYTDGKRSAMKERKRLLNQKTARGNGNTCLSVFGIHHVPAKFKK